MPSSFVTSCGESVWRVVVVVAVLLLGGGGGGGGGGGDPKDCRDRMNVDVLPCGTQHNTKAATMSMQWVPVAFRGARCDHTVPPISPNLDAEYGVSPRPVVRASSVRRSRAVTTRSRARSRARSRVRGRPIDGLAALPPRDQSVPANLLMMVTYTAIIILCIAASVSVIHRVERIWDGVVLEVHREGEAMRQLSDMLAELDDYSNGAEGYIAAAYTGRRSTVSLFPASIMSRPQCSKCVMVMDVDDSGDEGQCECIMTDTELKAVCRPSWPFFVGTGCVSICLWYSDTRECPL